MELTRALVEQHDTQGMWDLLAGFPNQWDEATKMTAEIELEIDPGIVNNICIAGMGGSALGGDLLRAYSYDTCPVPVRVCRGYELPGWVREDTLLIASSHSGNTEETLQALQSAGRRGAQRIAVTSDGELLVNATKEEFDYIRIPGGMPARAALAYIFIAQFRIFQELGYLEAGDTELDETELLLTEQCNLLSQLEDNEALTLAEEINDTLPLIYSNSTFMDPVNQRWRCQLEENSKTLAYSNQFPELNHNEIVGWERIAHLTGRLSVIMLVDQEDDPRIQKRMQITRDLIEGQPASITVLRSRGRSKLARMFSLIQLADWTSYYLAVINGVDPTPTALIDLFKSRLGEDR